MEGGGTKCPSNFNSDLDQTEKQRCSPRFSTKLAKLPHGPTRGSVRRKADVPPPRSILSNQLTFWISKPSLDWNALVFFRDLIIILKSQKKTNAFQSRHVFPSLSPPPKPLTPQVCSDQPTEASRTRYPFGSSVIFVWGGEAKS